MRRLLPGWGRSCVKTAAHSAPAACRYAGKLEAAARDALLPRLQAALDELLEAATPTEVRTVSARELATVCPASTIPANFKGGGGETPDAAVRVVTVGGGGCPCGGTHVKDTAASRWRRSDRRAARPK